MHKKRLIAEYPLNDLVLIGITASLKAYKLAWLINYTTALKLAKIKVNKIELITKEVLYIPYKFLYTTTHRTFILVRNKAIVARDGSIKYLVPTLRYLDYFFIIQDNTQTFNVDKFCKDMRDTNQITYITPLNVKRLENKISLLFDI